jgi:hypothetical protein
MFKRYELVFFNPRGIDNSISRYMIIKGKEYKARYNRKRVKRIRAGTLEDEEKQPIIDYLSKIMLLEELDEI